MATAQVNIKVTPFELQVIDEALRMYAYVNRRLSAKDNQPLGGYKLDATLGDGDPRKQAMAAMEIRRTIGMKNRR